MKVVPIVEAVVNKCIHWNFNDITQSVVVTPVEGFKICFKNTETHSSLKSFSKIVSTFEALFKVAN